MYCSGVIHWPAVQNRTGAARLPSSGVARTPCALGQEMFLRPLSTKTTEFEVKINYKNLKDAKFVLF